MLSSMGLTNFKCFEQLDIPFAPLTLLCGLNGMGKSSVIQALLTVRASFDSSTLNTNAADLRGPRDVLYEEADTDHVRFELRWDSGDVQQWSAGYSLSPDGSTLKRMGLGYSGRAKDAAEDERWRNRLGQMGLGHSPRGRYGPPIAGDVIYVGAERLGPRKIHEHSEAFAHPTNMGGRGEYTLSYLNWRKLEILERSDPRYRVGVGRGLFDVLEHWLQEVTPGTHLHLEEIPNADAIVGGFSFDRPGDVRTRHYRATNVGFGLSYVLPVLAGLLVPKGCLCLIENPEAHLHPRGQTRMAELAVRAAKAGVQVIAETHSDHFLDGVRISVREGLIAPEDVAVHYFERDGGKSVVVTPEIDADGRLSRWPAGFFDQYDDNLARLLAPRP